jgi:LysR family glycine cleavage system transcriptional activator
MRRRYLPLNALRTFEAAARQLSFTSAAEELNVTQSAISHQIRTLETALGRPLFRRLPRRLLLTDAGQTLLPVVRNAFDELTMALDRLRSTEHGGTLTVSVMPSFAAKWLVPRLSRFHAVHPDIDLRISANERIVDFTRDTIDVAVRFGDGSWPGLRCERMFGERVTPMCTPALAKMLKQPADLAIVTLLHEDMQPLGRFPGWVSWLDAAGVSGIDAARGPRFSHTHLMLQAAIDGHGVALGQTLLATDDLAAGRLVAPFALRLPTGFAYWLVSLPATAELPKIQAFRDWIRAETKGDPDPKGNPIGPERAAG